MRSYLEHITGPIPDADWQLFEQLAYPEQRQKGDILLDFQARCQQVWYLEKGAVRKVENVNGTLKTTHFYLAPVMFTVYHSLIREQPSDLSIVCESDCAFSTIPYRELVQLYQRAHAIERVGRIMAEHQFVEEFDLRRTWLNLNALERYEYLEESQPAIFQYFQLKDIATYLGITPVSLSRLRKVRYEKQR
jgi:hypothetical protein